MSPALSRLSGKIQREGLKRTLFAIFGRIVGPETSTPILAKVASVVGPTITYHGVQVDIHQDQISDTLRARFMKGSYESEERLLVDKYLLSDIDVIELGGGLGFLSCYIDKIIDGGLIVVEPNQELIPIIERNKKINNADFIVLNQAYAPNKRQTTFTPGELLTTGQTQTPGNRGAKVATTSISGLIKRAAGDIVNVVVDVEGKEKDLVKKELSTLEKYCLILIVEIHNTDDNTISEVNGLLSNSKFTLVDKCGSTYVYRNNSIQYTTPTIHRS